MMKSSRCSLLLTSLAAVAAMAGNADARTWTQASSGKKIEADFVKLDGQTVVLSVGGRPAQVPLSALSAEDQAFIKEAAAGKGGGAAAGDWPQWRGADRSGISPDVGLLKTWPEGGPKQTWVFKDAGMGYGSVSIVKGKLYALGTRGEDSMAVCVDISNGSEVWSTKIGTDDQKGYNVGWGHGPRSTPTVSDGFVYVLDAKGNLACLDAAKGGVKWSKNLVSDFGGQGGGWGFSESPLVDDDKVVIAPGGSTAGIVALNKSTGETIWTATDVKPGKSEYASIVPAELNGTRQYLRLFASQLAAVSAKDGKLLWSTTWGGGNSPAVIPTPIISGNEVYITSGYGVGSKLVKVDASNAATDVWSNSDMKNKHGGVIKVGDHVFGFSEGGGLVCQKWSSGEIVWNEKGQHLGSTDSLTVADGMLFCLNQDSGTVTLAKAGPEKFEQLGQFKLDPQSPNRHRQGKVWSHPVVIGGKLYLRDQEYIVCYDLKG